MYKTTISIRKLKNNHDLLKTLKSNEERVINLRFGLTGGRQYTRTEVAEKLKLGKERIRQVEWMALLKLRHPARARILPSFLSLFPGEIAERLHLAIFGVTRAERVLPYGKTWLNPQNHPDNLYIV